MNLRNSLSALLSFGRERPEPEPIAVVAAARPQALSPAPDAEMIPTMNATSKLSAALDDMLKGLNDFLKGLPKPAGALPERNVSTVSVTERSLGLGNIRGADKRGAFAATVLKGGRLEAVVRFQLWGNGPEQADEAVEALHKVLLADRDTLLKLKIAGFLRLQAETSASAEHVAALNAWRKTAEYRVLYEYHYEDSDGARGLIARIPVHSDPETRNAPQRETTTVTDETMRWDNEAAPRLVVRGRVTIKSFSALANIPGAVPTGTVILRRTFDGAIGAPVNFLTLDDFFTNVGGSAPTVRHAEVSFASLDKFLAEFKTAGENVTFAGLKDDDPPAEYQARILTPASAIELPQVTDRLELIFQNPAFDQGAAVYLRAQR